MVDELVKRVVLLLLLLRALWLGHKHISYYYCYYYCYMYYHLREQGDPSSLR